MINKMEILPGLTLMPYVRCYALREFDTSLPEITLPLTAHHEFAITFSLPGDYSTVKNSKNEVISGSIKHIIPLRTNPAGAMTFNSNVKLFTIEFSPNGFYKIFGIPLNLLIDNLYEVSDIAGKELSTYYERLNEAKKLTEMKKLTDNFLLSHQAKVKIKNQNNCITDMSAAILKKAGMVDIKELAYEANMSLRSFETKFTEQVGTSPKVYAVITRFIFTLRMKLDDMSRNWTDVSHKSGYYDQMHFIRDFKRFTGETPISFYKNAPVYTESSKFLKKIN